MKANELMIGDWVMLDMNWAEDDPMYARLNYQPYQIKCGEDFDLAEETNCIGDADAYQPISLTHEILEVNGWEKVPQPGCANPFHWQIEKYEEDRCDEAYLLYRIKAYDTFFRGMLVTINYPSACETISFRKQIEYVHELQHALRLCGIDKEIVVR